MYWVLRLGSMYAAKSCQVNKKQLLIMLEIHIFQSIMDSQIYFDKDFLEYFSSAHIIKWKIIHEHPICQ